MTIKIRRGIPPERPAQPNGTRTAQRPSVTVLRGINDASVAAAQRTLAQTIAQRLVPAMIQRLTDVGAEFPVILRIGAKTVSIDVVVSGETAPPRGRTDAD